MNAKTVSWPGPRNTPDAVIFDLDGTLIDSAPDLHRAANLMLAELGAEPLELAQIRSFIGNGVPKLVERALAARGQDKSGHDLALARFHDLYERNPTALTRPYSGVRDLLAALARSGTAMAICTNKPAHATRLVLAGLGLEGYFDAIVGGDSLAVIKPDPAPLYRALQELGGEAERALFVGDSETDEATAHAAGIRFAFFTGGYRKKPPEAFRCDLRFDDFTALAGILAR